MRLILQRTVRQRPRGRVLYISSLVRLRLDNATLNRCGLNRLFTLNQVLHNVNASVTLTTEYTSNSVRTMRVVELIGVSIMTMAKLPNEIERRIPTNRHGNNIILIAQLKRQLKILVLNSLLKIHLHLYLNFNLLLE